MNLTEKTQKFLSDAGIDPGPIDGIPGKKTGAALDELKRQVFEGDAEEGRTVTIRRAYEEDQTIGKLETDGFTCVTIERAWLDNKKRVSCIPEGEYDVEFTYSPRFQREMYLIKNVSGRSGCRIHAANYARQLNGCVSLGATLADIDGDGNNDVTNSRNTLNEFENHMGRKPFKLKIVKA